MLMSSIVHGLLFCLCTDFQKLDILQAHSPRKFVENADPAWIYQQRSGRSADSKYEEGCMSFEVANLESENKLDLESNNKLAFE